MVFSFSTWQFLLLLLQRNDGAWQFDEWNCRTSYRDATCCDEKGKKKGKDKGKGTGAGNVSEQHVQRLRFRVGDAVECRTGPNEWSKGKVVAHRDRDERVSPGMALPYQIKLDEPSSLIILAPDDDQTIRKA